MGEELDILARAAKAGTAIKKAKNQRDQHRQRVRGLVEKVNSSESLVALDTKAVELVHRVAGVTRDSLAEGISRMVSEALAVVFEDPYRFVVEFDVKGGRTQTLVSFERQGQKVQPMDGSGFGPVDISSIALRLVAWSLSNPRTRPLFLIDEPFRNLDVKRQPAASALLSKLSHELDLQMVISTHQDALADEADAVFRVQEGEMVGGYPSAMVVRER